MCLYQLGAHLSALSRNQCSYAGDGSLGSDKKQAFVMNLTNRYSASQLNSRSFAFLWVSFVGLAVLASSAVNSVAKVSGDHFYL